MQANSQPLISVVMATYNGKNFLAEQIDSLLAQTYSNIEIVICDDASTDGTSLLLAQYAAKYSHIRVYHNKENIGFIRNFERAISLSSGSLVALCDQDDYWYPEKLSIQFKSLGNADLVYCDSQICDKNLVSSKQTISTISNCLSYNSCLQQAVFCRIYGNTMLFKKSMLQGGLPFPTMIPHDWWIAYLASCKAGIVFCNRVLVKYRQHDQNLIGAATGKSKKDSASPTSKTFLQDIRKRMQLFYETCPEEKMFEKNALQLLNQSYQDFSLKNNIARVRYFLKYRKWLLAVKKRSALRNWLFCLKMFVKIK
ncbi:MAG: glycosyltransferase family 2 protein [Chitinophagia bacterium]|nr:glycosyltransferase family 2 protein [Chitinophagia bacterium]